MALTAEFGIQPFQTQEEAKAYRENVPRVMRSTARGPIQGLSSLSGISDLLTTLELSADSQARARAYEEGLFDFAQGSRPEYGKTRQKYLENIGEALAPGEDVEDVTRAYQTLTELSGLGIAGKQATDLIRKHGPNAITKIKSIFIKNPETTVDDAVQIALSERTGYMPSTSGYASPKTKMYHGTKEELPEELLGFGDYASPTNASIYGDGFYSTSRPGTSKGYAGKDGYVYQVTPKKEAKLFDMEQSVPPNIKQYIKKSYDRTEGEYDEGLVFFLEENPKASLVELYTEMRQLSSSQKMPMYEVQDYFDELNSILMNSGYKGLRHKGGVLHAGNKKHEVNIYWNPQKDLDIELVSETTPKNSGGPVTQPLYTDKRYLF